MSVNYPGHSKGKKALVVLKFCWVKMNFKAKSQPQNVQVPGLFGVDLAKSYHSIALKGEYRENFVNRVLSLTYSYLRSKPLSKAKIPDKNGAKRIERVQLG